MLCRLRTAVKGISGSNDHELGLGDDDNDGNLEAAAAVVDPEAVPAKPKPKRKRAAKPPAALGDTPNRWLDQVSEELMWHACHVCFQRFSNMIEVWSKPISILLQGTLWLLLHGSHDLPGTKQACQALADAEAVQMLWRRSSHKHWQERTPHFHRLPRSLPASASLPSGNLARQLLSR